MIPGRSGRIADRGFRSITGLVPSGPYSSLTNGFNLAGLDFGPVAPLPRQPLRCVRRGGVSTVRGALAVSRLHDDGPCDAVAHALLILREREEHDDDVEEEERRRELHEVAQNRLSKRDWSAVDAHHLQLERALSE